MGREKSKGLKAVVIAGVVVGAAIGAVLLIRSARQEAHRLSPGDEAPYVGSKSCRECHERFYELWSSSHHGKAMQPVTPELAATQLTPLAEPITVGNVTYSVDLEKLQMVDDQGNTFKLVHAMGGKNTFFFLTPLERGRLQVMPLSYNLRAGKWYDTTKSMVRHFVDIEDEAIDWTDRLLTFNTACFSCHVSQLAKNYDAATDTYHTTWLEPGINCEACHGPCEDHIKVCRAAPKGVTPTDLKLKIWRTFSVEQINDACTPCHAKGRPIAGAFNPGDRFFDFYDLVTLEDQDFYADGRDLGENYTQTSWMMSPCAKSGKLSCIHCHTSSGRYRFMDDRTSKSCQPCHAERVKNIATHTHHAYDKENSPTCVSCHMPMTEFGRMMRSDHSMRPPSPAATLTFKSPNACNICHEDKSTEWSAKHVAKWHPEPKWQPKIMRVGGLVDAARKGKWDQLPAMITYIREKDADPVVITSLLRLFNACPQQDKWPVIRECMTHSSPLVRGAAALALRDDVNTPRSAMLLLSAMADDFRMVRVYAASAFSQVPRNWLALDQLAKLEAAEKELVASFDLQPDRWTSHYNRGNYLADRGNLPGAIAAYRVAMKYRGDVIPPYVNAAMAASQLGNINDAIRYLKQAYEVDPKDGSVNFNLGLALAEIKDLAGAQKHLALAMEHPPSRAQAAYNLAVITGAKDPAAAAALCREAVETEPDNPRYAYTLAFYLVQAKEVSEAIGILETVVKSHPGHRKARHLLQNCRNRK